MQRIGPFCCVRALREASAQHHFGTIKYSMDNFVIKGLHVSAVHPERFWRPEKRSSLCKTQTFAHHQGCPDLPPNSTAVSHLDLLWEAISRSRRDVAWSHKCPSHFELQLSSSTLTLYAGVAERGNNSAWVRA